MEQPQLKYQSAGIVILADDLTGANDTAIQFVNRGFSALVFIHSVPVHTGLFDKYNVISINTNSRGLNADDAYNAVYDAAKQLGAGYVVYKKVDSVLRGNPGRELAALMDALNFPLALAAPSFPANGSVLENGMIHGTDAVRIFADGTGRKTENIPLEEIRRGVGAVTEFINTHNSGGTQVFVADAVSDDDLKIIYRASAALGRPHILTGSAGLAGQMARCLGKGRTIPVSQLPVLSPALVIAGTRQRETAVQIRVLCEKYNAPVTPFKVCLIADGRAEEAAATAYAGAVQQMKQNAAVCIIAVESMFCSETTDNGTVRNYAEGDETGMAISTALGNLCEKLMGTFRFPVILSTGGDTSLAICRRLGIQAIEPLAEMCPGIPLGRVSGGAYDGHFIITKSGRFGNPGALVEIMDHLGGARFSNM